MRVFAGPNGSGKSTLKSVLPQKLLGVYLNPDDIERDIRVRGFLDLRTYKVASSAEDTLRFFAESQFLGFAGLAREAKLLRFSEGCLNFSEIDVNSYFASVAVDFIRQQLFRQQVSFTFETVMSHASKVDVFRQAQSARYRTYLYFVATEDPAINISRVRNRVALGGHSVPEDRIVSRYHRSLTLLVDAIRLTNRAYIFDNSGDSAEHKHTWLAEITEGRSIEMKTDRVPAWFKRAVLDRAGH